jgi:hypothetical protein
MNSFQMAERLTKLESASAFDLGLRAAIWLHVACANFPGSGKGQVLHIRQGSVRREVLTLGCRRTRWEAYYHCYIKPALATLNTASDIGSINSCA